MRSPMTHTPSGELVDARRHVEVGLRETALGVSRELETDLVPAVQMDVGMVVGRLGGLGHAIDEGDRLGKILKRPFACDRLSVALPLAGGEVGVDLRAREKHCANEDTPAGGR